MRSDEAAENDIYIATDYTWRNASDGAHSTFAVIFDAGGLDRSAQSKFVQHRL